MKNLIQSIIPLEANIPLKIFPDKLPDLILQKDQHEHAFDSKYDKYLPINKVGQLHNNILANRIHFNLIIVQDVNVLFVINY